MLVASGRTAVYYYEYVGPVGKALQDPGMANVKPQSMKCKDAGIPR